MDPPKKTKKEKKHPRVPIKTYKWEDIKRARRKGGYPWTYLYKQPFDEQVDAEQYTMNSLRKSKSSSTVEKSGVEISDVTDNEESEGKMDTLQIVTEPDDRSARNSIGSLVIEECEMSDVAESDQKPENMALESADSSDNISQYLDKEDRGPDKEFQLKNSDVTDQEKEDEKENEKDDTQSKRKRKMSAESSYSRISSTKDAVLKKIRDTKNKIKIPKLTFPVNKLKKPVPKTKNVSPEPKKDTKKKISQPKDVKPVYIHIPLKPPPGETDEFSYLEFEESPKIVPAPVKGVGSFKLLAKNIKRLQEKQETLPNIEDISDEETTKKSNDTEDTPATFKNQNTEQDPTETVDKSIDDFKESELENDKNKETLVENKSVDVQQTADKTIEINESIQADKNVCDEVVAPSDTSIEEIDVLVEDVTSDIENNAQPSAETAEKKGILKKSAEVIDESDTKTEKTTLKGKQERAKSEEPEKKRKLSLESSYSRKSLSKLEIMKKLRETSEKIKNTFSLNKKKKGEKSQENITTPKETQPKKKAKKQKPEKPVKPVYIHIPLKSTEDEKIPEEDSTQLSNSPESPVRSDVQFIILTAPSDDEILDDHSSDVPETPSSENKTFFDGKIEELRKLAKDVVNNVSESVISHKLESVEEETSNDNKSEKDAATDVTLSTSALNLETADTSKHTTKIEEQDIPKEVDETMLKIHDQIKEKIMIDVEDGLSESVIKEELSDDRQTTSNKSVPPESEAALNLEHEPSVKKKVSFKRRSKTSKDGSYEEIGPQDLSKISDKPQIQPQETKELAAPDLNHGVTDDEQLDLDERITTSLKDDEDKWSKASDHEYEPVNPPPEVQIFTSTPTINIEEIGTMQPGNRHLEVLHNQSDLPVDNGISHRTNPPSIFENEEVANLPPVPAQQLDDRNQDIDQSVTEKSKDPNKFQLAWKNTTNQFKNKLQNLKKSHTPQDNTPKAPRFKIEKPKFSLPKIPDKTKINLPSLPSFNLRRTSASGKRPLKERQQSTESNVGGSKKSTFDFSTYPRMFKKKSKPKNEQKQELDLASVPSSTEQEVKPKIWGGDKIVRISLHSEEFNSDENLEKPSEMDIEYKQSDDENNEYLPDEPDEDQITSHIRYKDDIDIEDEFESQNINNDDYLNRWNRGNFNPETDIDYGRNFEISRYEVTDLDFPDDTEHHGSDYNFNHNRERYSSGSSFGGQRVGGVLEEINPDEFFLRQKGISQDNIEVGMYLSSEIKEAFRTPANALSKMEDKDFNLQDSNQSLPETPKKHKPIKKPKRKKTPYVSHEKISNGESDDDDDFGDIPPSRPKRRSKRISKTKNIDNIIPYQETIHLETGELQSTNILSNYDKPVDSNILHQNEKLRYDEPHADNLNFEYIDESQIEKPAAPPRKHKSLKSLTSENDSILEDMSSQLQTPEIDNEHRIDNDFIITSTYPLQRPTRKKSRSSLQSRTSLQSKETPQKDEEYLSSSSQLLSYENQTPCVEEPCVQDIRDHMGYAIIDKQKIRDPPLPPPRPPGRKKRSANSEETNFFTVPRQSRYDDTPVRPLRNYSTLGQTKKISEPATYENKENIDVIQYIEVEDDSNRHLQSGDIIRKMKDRPLPAPPRPPRKSRVLQNITSKENIMEEMNGSTETSNRRPVSDDDTCDIERQDFSLLPPNSTNVSISDYVPDHQNIETRPVEKHLITPDYFTHHETITHGSLIVQSLNGDKIVQDSELTRIIPISPESDDETSSVPEDFKNLKDPPEVRKSPIPMHSPSPINTEVDILKAHKLQVVDLDIDTLTVNKLLAGKIIVSEIDSHSIRTDELNSKSGTIEVSSPETIRKSDIITSDNSQQVCIEEKTQYKEATSQTTENIEEKKTSPDVKVSQILNETEELHVKRTRSLEEMSVDLTSENLPNQTNLFNQQSTEDIQNEPPEPPPRSLTVNLETNFEIDSECSHGLMEQSDKVFSTSNDEIMQEPDVDDEPPPRPPQPHLDYIPSQPPPSFYALRAQKYLDTVESNIPKIPRRKRPPRSISSSEDSVVTPVSRRTYNRSPEPSISQLSGQLIRTCGSTAHNALRRLITDITNNVKKNADGKLDLHVMTIILLILVAGLILLGYGEEKTVVHLHHWEYFNPPRDL